MSSGEKRLYFYETTDLHSHIYEAQVPYGLAKIASLIEEKRREHKNLCLIDNGDFLQGTPLASYMALRHQEKTPKPLIEALNLLKYDYFNIGNHEFNFGTTYLNKAIELFRGQVLCANCVNEDGMLAFGKAYDLFELDGIKVAIIGLITSEVPKWEKKENISGLTFKDPVEVCKKYAKSLRDKVDLLLVSYHGGPEKDFATGEALGLDTKEHAALRLVDEVPEIDAIFCGHQHRLFSETYKGKVLISPAWRGEYVAELACVFDCSGKKPKLKAIEPKLIKTSDYQASDRVKEALLPWLDEVEQWLDKPLGYATTSMQIKDIVQAASFNHPYLDFVNEIQLKRTGADISATSLFGLGASGLASQVRVRDIVSNYMYSNSLKVLKITGEDLKNALEHCASFFTLQDDKLALKVSEENNFIPLYNYDVYKGINYTFDIRKPEGSRVVSLTYKGANVYKNDTFTLALNNYRALGGGGYAMFSEDKIVDAIEQDVVDLMISYIQSNPFVNSYRENSFKVIGHKR